jgi:adenylate cyclase
MQREPLIRDIADWLLGQALDDPFIEELFPALCERLRASGLPIDRAMLSWPTLHPVYHSEQLIWRPGRRAELTRFRHAVQRAEAFLSSALHHVLRHRLPTLRRRLTGPEAMLDFDFLSELRDDGFTDYVVVGAEFQVGGLRMIPDVDLSGLVGSWATKREGGFADSDLEALSGLMRAYTVAVRSVLVTRVMNNFAATYFGPTTGAKVLAGAIRRGDGERLRALVWFSDLRGSTALSHSMPAESYLELLNRYFEATAQPVLDAGGEVLTFLGDGVLAVFPIGDQPREAVRRATAAVDSALARVATANVEAPPGQPAIAFGVGLAIGEVLLGNIGVPDRLDFTVIGEVVNVVIRIERHTKRVGRTVLATAEVAVSDPGGWRSLGPTPLDGLEQPVELYARVRA